MARNDVLATRNYTILLTDMMAIFRPVLYIVVFFLRPFNDVRSTISPLVSTFGKVTLHLKADKNALSIRPLFMPEQANVTGNKQKAGE